MHRLVAIFVLGMVVGTSMAAQTADRTSVLLAELDHCDYREPVTLAPKLDVLITLADGRANVELAGLLNAAHRECIGGVTTFGKGERLAKSG